MWQEIIVGIIVVFAVFCLIRRLLPFGKKSSGCGGCGTCGSNPKTKSSH